MGLILKGMKDMFYIPNDWIKKKDNELKIHKILNDNLYTDLNMNENIKIAIQKLNNIGETTIIEKLKDGTIVIN